MPSPTDLEKDPSPVNGRGASRGGEDSSLPSDGFSLPGVTAPSVYFGLNASALNVCCAWLQIGSMLCTSKPADVSVSCRRPLVKPHL